VGSAHHAVLQSAVVAESEFAVGVDDVAADPALRPAIGGGWRAGLGPGLIGRQRSLSVQGGVRPAAVVIGDEGVAEALKLGKG
jgi:hypothetical protein